MRRKWLVFSILVMLFLAACSGGSAGPGGEGEQSAGSGLMGANRFQPMPDGFGFRNYGMGYPEGDLTIDEVRRQFGDAVCALISGESCVPTPAAQLWIDTMNGYMQSGRCEGFTVLSYRFFTDQLAQDAFESSTATTYDLAQQEKLMREISLNFTYQVLEEIWRTTVDGTPTQVVDALQDAHWPVNVGIFNPDGSGHSLLAYGLDDVGNRIFRILAYDNNAPGQDVAIEVDTASNTWMFTPPELAPDGSPDDWQGDATSFSLNFTPLAAYDQPVACPFCQADITGMKTGQRLASVNEQANQAGFLYITLNGSMEIGILDPEGRVLGFSNGAIINEIPGARLIRLRGAMAGEGVIAALPLSNAQDLTILLPGTNPASNVDLRAFNPGINFSVDGLNLQEGQTEKFNLSADLHSLAYLAGGAQQPGMKLAFQQDGVNYLATVNNVDMQAGESVTVGLDPQTSFFEIQVNDLADPLLGMAFARVDADGSQIFANNQIAISPNGTAAFDLLGWDGQKTLNEHIDSESDGVTVLDVPLSDQPLVALFSSSYTADNILNYYDQFAPYLDGSETEPLPYILASYQFDGSQLGRIYHVFGNFGFSREVLTDHLVNTLACPGNISLFLFEQHLPASGPGSLEEWIAGFPEEYAQYMPELMAELKIRNDALIEGTFLGLEGEELNTFIEGYLAENLPPAGTQAPAP